MQREQFALATKASSSLLSPLERRLARRVVPHIPSWLETHHLTLMTLVWCAGLVLFGYSFVLPEHSHFHLLLVLSVFGGFVLNSFLAFTATGRLHISHMKLGPTEFRIALIVINTLVIFYGTR